METWVIIASGQSLTSADVDYVKGLHEAEKVKVVAISNVGLDKAPWADCLVSHDTKWWRANPEAMQFAGTKYARFQYGKCKPFRPVVNGSNSGLMGMEIAWILGAQRIILLGFDMHGTHYFGAHPEGLKNTDEGRFAAHIKQFDKWKGCEVINCTPGSALNIFPKAELRTII